MKKSLTNLIFFLLIFSGLALLNNAIGINLAANFIVIAFGYWRISRRADQQNHLIYTCLFAAIVLSSQLTYGEGLIPFLFTGWVGYAIHYRVKKDKRLTLEYQQQMAQITQLKQEMKELDQRIAETNHYFEEKDIAKYAVAARPIYSDLEALDKKLYDVHDLIADDYPRLHDKIISECKQIKLTFRQLNLPFNPTHADLYLQQVKLQAPEILPVYRSIQTDHEMIVKKIKDSGNGDSQELLALHESYMARFDNIFQAYMAIKETPKNYYNAEERLEQAKVALEKIDKTLDEQLRQLNEADLSDFEVSLRLMLDE